MHYIITFQHINITNRHTFLERGHIRNKGDSIQSVIERASNDIPVSSPDQWYTIVGTAKKTRKQDHTKSLNWTSQQNSSISGDKDEENGKVYLSKMKVVEVLLKYPNICFFKYIFDEPSRKRIETSINNIERKQKYCGKTPLSKKWCDHLQFMPRKSYIWPVA